MASRRTKKKPKGRRNSGIFSRLPRGLIWAWGVWALAVIITLLVIYAPPWDSAREAAISLFKSDSATKNRSVSIAARSTTPDSGTGLQPQHPTESRTTTEKTNQRLSATEISQQTEESTKETSTNKVVQNQTAFSAVKNDSQTVEPDTVIAVQDSDELNQTAPEVSESGSTRLDEVSLQTDSGTSAASSLSVPTQKTAVTSSGKQPPVKPVHETTADQIINDARSKKKDPLGNVSGEIAPDTTTFFTRGLNLTKLHWDKFDFEGRDNNDRVVRMSLLVLSEEYFWRFGGLSIVSRNGKQLSIKEHLSDLLMLEILEGSKGVICIGTASEEGGLKLEEYRASARAGLFARWIIEAQPGIEEVFTLALGQYQKNKQSSTLRRNLSSEDQRRIILINITRRPQNANLLQAIRNGLNGLKPLPFELQQFSRFDLQNRSSYL